VASIWRAFVDRGPRPPRPGSWRVFGISAIVLFAVFFALGQYWQSQIRSLMEITEYSVPLAIASPLIAAVFFALLILVGRGLRGLYRWTVRKLDRLIGRRAATALGWILVVVLTFDDGGCDFYRQAFPILREFGWPATVYLTSYYCNYNRPVFDVMCSYLLWKGRSTKLNLRDVISGSAEFDLESKSNRERTLAAVRLFARHAKFSARQKDELLKLIAERLSIDYERILAKRILHLLSPEEVVELVAEGVDIQLHTHRHHAPQKRESFLVELKENRAFISKFTKLPRHFAYPHGLYEECYADWLSSFGVTSATTCASGLATKYSNPYNLPRLVDTSSLRLLELEGWLSGFAKFFPRKQSREASLIPPFYY